MKIEKFDERYQITMANIEELRELDSTIYEKMVNMLGWKNELFVLLHHYFLLCMWVSKKGSGEWPVSFLYRKCPLLSIDNSLLMASDLFTCINLYLY